jgi:hypothetical protein
VPLVDILALLVELMLLVTGPGVLLLDADADANAETVAEEFDATAYETSSNTNASDPGAILEGPNGGGISR